MSWTIVFGRSAEKDLSRLSPEMRQRIGRGIRGLADDPFEPASKPLKGREQWRLRIGDYRVLYTVEHAPKNLTIVAVGHRREVYR
ncbi:MAG TPA: type II toxin-antitoxin system RelE/ParE family toxin [Chthoniobacterales bacterium]|nr:type II toxin-antitoxin system RelE/ParE family toxin [Chthoniobacterales bacterium]